jgi:hypothetical protein
LSKKGFEQMPQSQNNRQLIFRRRKLRASFDMTSRKTMLLFLAMLLAIGIASAQRASAGDIIPQTGTWQGHSQVREVSGCTAEIRAEIEAEPQEEMLYSQPVAFSAPFDLRQFNTAWETDVNWARRGLNFWSGTMVETERSPFGSVTSTTEIETFVLNDVKILQKAIVTVSFSRALAKQLGTSSPCVIDADITHQRVGP